MEGSYWLRFGVIIAMMLGCVYVLTPSFLADGSVDLSDYDNGGTTLESEPALEVWFEGGADAASAASELEATLASAGVAVERVGVRDGRLVVYLKAGTTKDEVVAAASGGADVAKAYALSAVGIDAEALASLDDPTAALASAVAAAESVQGEPLPLTVIGVLKGADSVQVTFDQPVGDVQAVVLASGGEVLGHATVASPDANMAAFTVHPDITGDVDAITARLTGTGGRSYTRVELDSVGTDDAVDTTTTTTEVAWWESLLPDTKLSLGLDLQGGIDLTLQVDLEAAVFSQVQRDQVDLKDRIQKDGRPITVVRDRTRPALKIYTDEDFAVLQPYMREALGLGYTYLESATDDAGAYHVYRISETREEEITGSAVDQVLETLRRRVDSTGVKEPSIVKMGGGRINIQLPGVTGATQATEAIGTQAILEFRLVDEEVDDMTVERAISDAEDALPPEQFAVDDILNDWLRANGRMPEDRIIRWMYTEVSPGVMQRTVPMQLHDKVELTGADVNDAYVGQGQGMEPEVALSFKSGGKRRFCEITTENTNKRFAIILDDQIRSAPNINEPICGGRASIRMGGSMDGSKDANNLSLVLRTGSLTAPVDIGEIREIGPSLGADAIRSGVLGSMVGGSITLFFMGLWYRRPGLIADVALVLNVLLVFAILAMFGATLTLPGIAGVALTIGMAVDANIIVYERIREELKLGVHARKAVDTGYEKAVVAVLDANITTAIAGVVLYSYGTGPIKGFAVTLLIGIFTTLVTALFVTRTFMEMLTRNSSARLRI